MDRCGWCGQRNPRLSRGRCGVCRMRPDEAVTSTEFLDALRVVLGLETLTELKGVRLQRRLGRAEVTREEPQR